MGAIRQPSGKGVTTVIGKILPAVLKADGKPGEAWKSDLQAPNGDGVNVSIPPMFGGLGPALEIAGADTPKLGVGTAEPVFHGGG